MYNLAADILLSLPTWQSSRYTVGPPQTGTHGGQVLYRLWEVIGFEKSCDKPITNLPIKLQDLW